MFGVDVKSNRLKIRRAVALALLCASSPLWAAMGENIAISPRAMSLGNAVVADTVGTEAI